MLRAPAEFNQPQHDANMLHLLWTPKHEDQCALFAGQQLITVNGLTS